MHVHLSITSPTANRDIVDAVLTRFNVVKFLTHDLTDHALPVTLVRAYRVDPDNAESILRYITDMGVPMVTYQTFFDEMTSESRYQVRMFVNDDLHYQGPVVVTSSGDKVPVYIPSDDEHYSDWLKRVSECRSVLERDHQFAFPGWPDCMKCQQGVESEDLINITPEWFETEDSDGDSPKYTMLLGGALSSNPPTWAGRLSDSDAPSLFKQRWSKLRDTLLRHTDYRAKFETEDSDGRKPVYVMLLGGTLADPAGFCILRPKPEAAKTYEESEDRTFRGEVKVGEELECTYYVHFRRPLYKILQSLDPQHPRLFSTDYEMLTSGVYHKSEVVDPAEMYVTLRQEGRII